MTVTRDSGTVGGKAVRTRSHAAVVLAVSDRAERALEKQDLSSLMQLIMPGLQLSRLTRGGCPCIWVIQCSSTIIGHLSSTHLFSR